MSPTQEAVHTALVVYPHGLCRRDFARMDVYEVSARISEIEQRLGITIIRDRCRRHAHKYPFTLYRLETE